MCSVSIFSNINSITRKLMIVSLLDRVVWRRPNQGVGGCVSLIAATLECVQGLETRTTRVAVVSDAHSFPRIGELWAAGSPHDGSLHARCK